MGGIPENSQNDVFLGAFNGFLGRARAPPREPAFLHPRKVSPFVGVLCPLFLRPGRPLYVLFIYIYIYIDIDGAVGGGGRAEAIGEVDHLIWKVRFKQVVSVNHTDVQTREVTVLRATARTCLNPYTSRGSRQGPAEPPTARDTIRIII